MAELAASGARTSSPNAAASQETAATKNSSTPSAAAKSPAEACGRKPMATATATTSTVEAMVSALDTRSLLNGVVPGQGQENVVQAGGSHGEAADQGAARVGRVEQRPHLRGAAVSRHAQRQAGRVPVHGAVAEVAG